MKRLKPLFWIIIILLCIIAFFYLPGCRPEDDNKEVRKHLDQAALKQGLLQCAQKSNRVVELEARMATLERRIATLEGLETTTLEAK